MSRYYALSKNPGAQTSLAAGSGEAQPVTFTKKPKVQKSFLVSGGGTGTTGNSKPGKMTGEY